MRIVPVACLWDNYAYLVICEATGEAAVVDPSEAEPVVFALAAEKASLVAVWNTHHHWDHTDGNEELAARYPGIAVVAHASDRGRVPAQTVFVDDGDTTAIGTEVSARIIHNPGHTTGAISYFVESEPAVFTGDTLFCGGCGRMFEGNPVMMHGSLARLAELPGQTRVYCGHEYTEKNLAFAAAVEPQSTAIAERARRAKALQAKGEPTVPSTIADELLTNPFLRTGEPAVKAAVNKEAPAEVFAALRSWKDQF